MFADLLARFTRSERLLGDSFAARRGALRVSIGPSLVGQAFLRTSKPFR
jgi:hypothetical protein